MTVNKFYDFLREEGALKTFLRDILAVGVAPSGKRPKPSLKTYEPQIKEILDNRGSPVNRLLTWDTTENGFSYYLPLENLFWRFLRKEENK